MYTDAARKYDSLGAPNARTVFRARPRSVAGRRCGGAGYQRTRQLRAAQADECESGAARCGPAAGDRIGPDGLFAGGDFRAAYAPGVALTGAGQTDRKSTRLN